MPSGTCKQHCIQCFLSSLAYRCRIVWRISCLPQSLCYFRAGLLRLRISESKGLSSQEMFRWIILSLSPKLFYIALGSPARAIRSGKIWLQIRAGSVGMGLAHALQHRWWTNLFPRPYSLRYWFCWIAYPQPRLF